MKKHLTPMDLMRLDAAREGLDDFGNVSGRLPSVAKYNAQIKACKLLGRQILPIGARGIESPFINLLEESAQ